jgi:hypothetical protein
MERFMRSPKACRKFAEDCLRIAEQTIEEDHARMLFDMSKVWIQEALEAERTITAKRALSGYLVSRTKH